MTVGNKFDKNYLLTVQTAIGTLVEIKLPFTIEYDITRSILSSANVCQIRCYNLSEFNRNQIAYNSYNQSDLRLVQLQAGYGTSLTTIFTGNISRCWSVREGVNFITQIECYDGGFAFVNGSIDISFPAGTPLQVVITTLMSELRNFGITPGAIGTFAGVLTRSNTYSGNIAQILYEITGGAFFIDNGKAYCLKTTEFVQDLEVLNLIDADTGLLNTPVMEQTLLNLEMLFEPSINVGRLIFVKSLTNLNLNGFYIVKGIKHRGVISRAVSGSTTTNVTAQNTGETIPAIPLSVFGL